MSDNISIADLGKVIADVVEEEIKSRDFSKLSPLKYSIYTVSMRLDRGNGPVTHMTSWTCVNEDEAAGKAVRQVLDLEEGCSISMVFVFKIS